MHALIENNNIIRTTNNLRREFPNTSFPRKLPDEFEGWVKIAAPDVPEGKKIGDVVLVDGVPTFEVVDVTYNDERLLNHLANYRYQREIGGFTLNGMFIPTDEKTERRIIGARVKAESNPDYEIADWTTDNGETSTTLNAATIIAISDAFDNHVQKCFSAMTTVRSNINDYNTPVEIETAFDEAYNGQ
jgi:hypothetical protein